MASAFEGVKVFAATMWQDRDGLGEKVTSWLAAQDTINVEEIMVRQSSDEAFHCVSIIVFYKHRTDAKRGLAKPDAITLPPVFVERSPQPRHASETKTPRRLNFKKGE